MVAPPLQSLVKYDTPSLLTTKDKKAKGGAKGGKKLPPVETKQPLTQTEDILNSILPPRCARLAAHALVSEHTSPGAMPSAAVEKITAHKYLPPLPPVERRHTATA